MAKVWGLGQCCLDYIGKIVSYPPPDTKCEFSDMVIQGGGPVATALVALSRWGVPCAFAGVIGDDQFGIGPDAFAADPQLGAHQARHENDRPAGGFAVNARCSQQCQIVGAETAFEDHPGPAQAQHIPIPELVFFDALLAQPDPIPALDVPDQELLATAFNPSVMV